MKNLLIIIFILSILSLACSGSKEVSNTNAAGSNSPATASPSPTAVSVKPDITILADKLITDFKTNGGEKMDKLLTGKTVAVSGWIQEIKYNELVVYGDGYGLAVSCKRAQDEVDGPRDWDAVYKSFSNDKRPYRKDMDFMRQHGFITFTGLYSSSSAPTKTDNHWFVFFKECRIADIVWTR